MLEKQLEYIRSKTNFVPETAIILGSGLGGLTDKIEEAISIDYSKLEDFPVSTAPTHRGRFILGTLEGKKIIAMDGRIHLYEGYSAKEVAMPVRLTRILGAKNLIITNAAGGINKTFNVGDLMLIRDQISLFAESPLTGKNDESIGTRFPDMSNVYDKELRQKIKNSACNAGITLREGVYVQLKGPQFETPAEIKLLSSLGADAVGMSTAIEAIAAVHAGMKICGISLIANYASGILEKPLTAEEITESADKSADEFKKLIRIILNEI